MELLCREVWASGPWVDELCDNAEVISMLKASHSSEVQLLFLPVPWNPPRPPTWQWFTFDRLQHRSDKTRRVGGLPCTHGAETHTQTSTCPEWLWNGERTFFHRTLSEVALWLEGSSLTGHRSSLHNTQDKFYLISVWILRAISHIIFTLFTRLLKICSLLITIIKGQFRNWYKLGLSWA